MRRDGRCAMRNVCFVHNELLHHEHCLFHPLHRRNKCHTTSTKRQKYVRYLENIYFNSCGHAVFEFGIDYSIIILV